MYPEISIPSGGVRNSKGNPGNPDILQGCRAAAQRTRLKGHSNNPGFTALIPKQQSLMELREYPGIPTVRKVLRVFLYFKLTLYSWKLFTTDRTVRLQV